MSKSIYVPFMTTESEKRKSYAAALISEYTTNPQDCTMEGDVSPPLPPLTNRMYYGNATGPAEKMCYNHIGNYSI